MNIVSSVEPNLNLRLTKAKDPACLDAVKRLADRHRHELGFHARQSYAESLARGQLLVASIGRRLIGFARYHHRRDGRTTIYEIAADPDVRGRGIGRALIAALVSDCRNAGSRLLRLSCPVDLAANRFYSAVGFVRAARRSRGGRDRPLYEWEFPVFPERPMAFVASLTNAANDLKHVIRLWEAEVGAGRPFDHCILTPLFTESRCIDQARYMHDHWGVRVMFDSGGFFVQQGKVGYEELFVRLQDFYRANTWAEVFVLPDFVPTSRNSNDEVEERVRVTATEGVKFLRRMPSEIRSRALGVLQGRTPDQLKFCLRAYLDNGVPSLGFGSFDTGGAKAEINLLTEQSERRLAFVRDTLADAYCAGTSALLPDLHLFGVGSPALIDRFPRYLATSFDSSGWLRTAGFGNIYLPFSSRRNVTHGASALSCGEGLSAAAFYAAQTRSHHSCVFCRDFTRLQNDRYARMLHNALVFREMTQRSTCGAGVG